MTFSQNPLKTRFWASGFWMSILSSANFKKDPPWNIFFLSVHAPATSDIDDLYRGQNTMPSLPFHSPPHHPKDQACSLLCTYYNGNQCFPMGMKGYPPLLALPHHQHSKMASSPESHPRNLFLHHFHADQVFSFSEGCKGRSFRPKHGKLAFPDSLLLPSSCSVDHQLWLFPP